MSDKTLYLVQSSYSNTTQILDQLEKIYQTGDHIVLMGESVLSIQDPRLQTKQNVSVLENDAEILVQSLLSNIKLISYDQFADLILDFKRCISLK